MTTHRPHITVLIAFVALTVLTTAAVRAAGDITPVLAYEAPNGIHLVNSDGSDDHLVRGSIAGDQNPAWSPDGRRIVAVFAKVGVQGRLVLLDPATGRRTLVPVKAGDAPARMAVTPSWSSDGKSIIFESDTGPSSEPREYSVRPDGTGLKELLDGQYAYQANQRGDGTFVYAANPGLLVARGGAIRGLYDPQNGGSAWSPSWAPDGNSVVFVTDGDSPEHVNTDSGAEIHRVDADGTNDTRLTKNTAWDGDPTVSPDGSTIAFDTGRFGWGEIELMAADGSDQRRLTHELHGEACCPVWRP